MFEHLPQMITTRQLFQVLIKRDVQIRRKEANELVILSIKPMKCYKCLIKTTFTYSYSLNYIFEVDKCKPMQLLHFA